MFALGRVCDFNCEESEYSRHLGKFLYIQFIYSPEHYLHYIYIIYHLTLEIFVDEKHSFDKFLFGLVDKEFWTMTPLIFQ